MTMIEVPSEGPSTAPATVERPATPPEPVALPDIQIEPAPTQAPRLASLDIFRGITIAAMLLVNNPGKGTVYWPLEHADGYGWHGWTPTDLIFPFFLFIVGVAIPFSLGKRSMAVGVSRSRRALLGHIWGRALALFMLGELLTGIPFLQLQPVPAGFEILNVVRIVAWAFCGVSILLLLIPWRPSRFSRWLPVGVAVAFYALAGVIALINRHAVAGGLPHDFTFGNGLLRPENLRIPGVLQRIGICYGVAASIALYFGWRTVLVSAVAFMAVYSGLMLAAPFPNHTTGSLTREDNLSRRIDETLLIRYQRDADGHLVRDGRGEPKTVWNHAYGSYPDNEGALSTLPAIASVLIGILAGTWLRTRRPPGERGAGLLVFGLFVMLLGLAMGRWFMPINKDLWTPSFTVLTAGMGMLGLGVCFYFADVLGRRRWATPFTIYGMNAIAAYVAAGVVTRLEYLIKVKPAGHGQPIPLITFLRDWSAAAVGQVDTLLQHTHWTINTPQNTALAYSLLYVLAILVLMSVLYVLKIFVKV